MWPVFPINPWFPGDFFHPWSRQSSQEEAKAGLLSEGSGKAGEVELGPESQSSQQ